MSLDAAVTATAAERLRISAPTRVRSRFHVWLGLWMLAIVIIGFCPTYFSPLSRGTLAIPTVVHAHALVFLGWMAVMMTQVIVAARGNIRLHRRIGPLGNRLRLHRDHHGAGRGTRQRRDQVQFRRMEPR